MRSLFLLPCLLLAACQSTPEKPAVAAKSTWDSPEPDTREAYLKQIEEGAPPYFLDENGGRFKYTQAIGAICGFEEGLSDFCFDRISWPLGEKGRVLEASIQEGNKVATWHRKLERELTSDLRYSFISKVEVPPDELPWLMAHVLRTQRNSGSKYLARQICRTPDLRLAWELQILSLRQPQEMKYSTQWLNPIEADTLSGWRRDLLLICEKNYEKLFQGSLPPYQGPVDAAWLARFPAETALKLGRPDLALAALKDAPDSLLLAFQLYWVARAKTGSHQEEAKDALSALIQRMEKNADIDIEPPQIAARFVALLKGEALTPSQIRKIHDLLPAEIDWSQLPELALPTPIAAGAKAAWRHCEIITPASVFAAQVKALRLSQQAPRAAAIPDPQSLELMMPDFVPSRQQQLLLQVVLRPELIREIDPKSLHQAPRSCGSWPLASRKSDDLSPNEAIYWAVYLGGLKVAQELRQSTRSWPAAERRLVDLAILCGLEGLPKGWEP